MNLYNKYRLGNIRLFLVTFYYMSFIQYGLLSLRSRHLALKHTSLRNIHYSSISLRLLSSSSSSSSSSSNSVNEINSKTTVLKPNSESYLSNSRFWSKTFTLDVANINNSHNDTTDLLGYVHKYLCNEMDGVTETEVIVKPPQMGMVIIPKLNLLIPIHEGKFQLQHAIMHATIDDGNEDISRTKAHKDSADEVATSQATIENKKLSITICGFSNRAQQVNTSPTDEERPINYIRLAALDKALKDISAITGEELLSAELAGTSPARIYRSFVAPRPKAIHTLEPIDRAAKRTATQIELSLRQVRADQATYLRNTDRSAYYNSLVLNTNTNDSITAQNSINDSSTEDLINSSGSSIELKPRIQHPVVILLDNIRSAFNVGSIFRTAETAGAAEIVTCGITAHPPHPKLQKTALSAVDVVPSRHFEDTITAIHKLRSEGYQIIVMETTALSKIYTDISYPKKDTNHTNSSNDNNSYIGVALIAGNEVTGVDPRVIEMADVVVEIPTYGIKNSLNVASAVPIVLFEIIRQWNSKL